MRSEGQHKIVPYTDDYSEHAYSKGPYVGNEQVEVSKSYPISKINWTGTDGNNGKGIFIYKLLPKIWDDRKNLLTLTEGLDTSNLSARANDSAANVVSDPNKLKAIAEYLGGRRKRSNRKMTNRKMTNRKRSNRKRTNRKMTNRKRTNRSNKRR